MAPDILQSIPLGMSRFPSMSLLVSARQDGRRFPPAVQLDAHQRRDVYLQGCMRANVDEPDSLIVATAAYPAGSQRASVESPGDPITNSSTSRVMNDRKGVRPQGDLHFGAAMFR